MVRLLWLPASTGVRTVVVLRMGENWRQGCLQRTALADPMGQLPQLELQNADSRTYPLGQRVPHWEKAVLFTTQSV